MKIVIIIFSLILKLLIAGIGAFLMFSQDTGKEQWFCLLIMAIVLAIIEIIHIGGLIFVICEEKKKEIKIQLLREFTFNDKNLKEIKIGDSQKEIYKIFCNTLVDL